MEFMFSLWAGDVIYDPELQMQSGDAATIGTSARKIGCAINFLWNVVQKFYFTWSSEGCRKTRSDGVWNSCKMHGKLTVRVSIAFNSLKDLWYIRFNIHRHVNTDFDCIRAEGPLEKEIPVGNRLQTKPHIKIPTFFVEFIHSRDFCRSPEQKETGSWRKSGP